MRDYADGDHAWAAFEAITLLEEVGKLLFFWRADQTGQFEADQIRNHRAKYSFAIYQTLFVNSRVARIYGDFESQFARWFKDNQLFAIRNAALYVERKSDGTQVVPAEAVDPMHALLLVCVAGEAWAEVQGDVVGSCPSDWQSILTAVDTFREEHWTDRHTSKNSVGL